MEFRLLYVGDLLKSAGRKDKRAWEKHALRKYFHHQLKALWERHPVLSFYQTGPNPNEANTLTLVEQLARDHRRGGIGFVPLVTKANVWSASLTSYSSAPEIPAHC